MNNQESEAIHTNLNYNIVITCILCVFYKKTNYKELNKDFLCKNFFFFGVYAFGSVQKQVMLVQKINIKKFAQLHGQWLKCYDVPLLFLISWLPSLAAQRLDSRHTFCSVHP